VLPKKKRAKLDQLLSLSFLTLDTSTMSEHDPEDVVLPEITSANPPAAVISSIAAAYIGTFRFEVHPDLIHPDSDNHLTDITDELDIPPPRETTENHVDRTENSLRTYQEWR
jgi:hypothetical protein